MRRVYLIAHIERGKDNTRYLVMEPSRERVQSTHPQIPVAFPHRHVMAVVRVPVSKEQMEGLEENESFQRELTRTTAECLTELGYTVQHSIHR